MKDYRKQANIFNNAVVLLNILLLVILLILFGLPKVDITQLAILLAAQIFFRLYSVPLMRSSFLSLAFLLFLIVFFHSGYLAAALFALVSILIADGLFKREGFIEGLWLGCHFSFGLLGGGLIYYLLGGSYGAEALKVDNYANLVILLLSYNIIQILISYTPLLLSRKVEPTELIFIIKWETIVFLIYSSGALTILWFLFNKGPSSFIYFIPLMVFVGLIIRPIIEKAILAEELGTIVQTGALIAANLSLEYTMEQTHKLMRKFVEFENFFLSLIEPAKDQLKLIYDSRKGFLEEPMITSLQKGLSGKVCLRGEPLIIKDTRKVKDRIEMEKGMLSEIIVPIKFGKETVGVIDLEHSKPYHFTSRDLVMLNYIVSYIAIVIHFYHMLQPLAQVSLQARSFIDELSTSLEQINANAQEISSTLGQMSQEMNRQGNMLIQEILSIDAVFGSSQTIADNSRLADQKNKIADEIVDSNRSDIEKTALYLSEAQKIIQSIASAVKDFKASFDKIKEFIDTIMRIARQTAILSLNASIEASKAGDYGKGFSVVAEEISNLAEESAKASEDISSSAQHVKAELDRLIKQAFSGEEKAQEASAITDRFYEALSKILEATSESNQLVNQIAQETDQQRAEIARITQNTNQLDQINRQNVESIENIVTSVHQQTASLQNIYTKASELEGMINSINQLISSFSGKELAS